MRMPAWCRQFILSLLVLATAMSFSLSQVHAQAIPVPAPVPPSHLAAAFFLRYVAIPAVERLTAIKAALLAQGAAVAGVTRSAFMLTSAAGASFSLTSDVHIAPTDYSTPGAPNYGTGMILENPSTKESVIVLISTQTKEEALNPDLGDSQPPTLASGDWTLPAAPHIHFAPAFLGALDTLPLPIRGYDEFTSPQKEWILRQMTVAVEASGFQSFDAFSLVANKPECIAATNAGGAAQRNNRFICVWVKPKQAGLPERWFWLSLNITTQYKTCSEPRVYDINTNTCLYKSEGMDDGLCLVSPSSASVGYLYNAADPDCVKVVSIGGMNFQPGTPGGNGAPPVSPSVTVVDPSSGSVLIQEAPALADSTAPTTKVTTRVPDRTNNTTVQNVSTVAPGTQSAANPTAAPVQSSAVRDIYPGTNPSAAPTGPAMQQVAVSNWPAVLKVEGTVTCSNCAQANTGNGNTQPVNVNVPDRVKINGEVPDGVPTDLPTAPADLKDVDTFLDPLKDKFAGLMDFQLPAHASSCPALHIQWRAWGLDLDVSSDYMCQTLEQYRTLLQGLMYFSYVVAAIIIVLGA